MTNPVYYFEIPVLDLERAIAFYQTVLGASFERKTVDGHEMAFFQSDDSQPGASGALAQGDGYTPSLNGCLIYFDVGDIDEVLRLAEVEGSRTLYPKTFVGEGGYVAELEDSEGNRIALNSLPE